MTLDAAAMQALGWAGPPHADRAAALAAIAAGIGNQPPVGRPPFGGGAKQPAGKQPAPPSGKPGVPPPAGKQGATPPPATGGGSGALPAPAAQKLEAIRTDLADLKKLIEEFNFYFNGEKGVWIPGSRGLREVWNNGEMTADPGTRSKSKQLQNDMRLKAGKLDSNLKSISAVAKGVAIPQQAELDALKSQLLPFKESLLNDDPNKYSRSSSAIAGIKIP